MVLIRFIFFHMTIPMRLLYWEEFWSGAIWKIVEVWDNLDESEAEILKI